MALADVLRMRAPMAHKSIGITAPPKANAKVTVAVIGAGPSGMFFCHAMEKLRQTANANIDYDVTCFERSSKPGGVWRSASGDGEDVVDMYEELWMNGPSHLIELPDYTFDEHFGKPVSVYMKRQDVYDYITGRVTRNCPDFFERYVKPRMDVQLVEYNESISKFVITTKDLNADEIKVQHFDKCVWACGRNSKRLIPPSLLKMFKEGGFKGDMIHSADSGLEHYVKGKRILLVGASYSGEDVALQSIKFGVERVYILARNSFTSTQDTKYWPGDKVEFILNANIHAIAEDGNCIQFKETEWRPPGTYVTPENATGILAEIRDIDTVVFCTGYKDNYGNLSESLRKFVDVDDFLLVEMPEDWKQKPHSMDALVGGHVKPGRVWNCPSEMIHPNFYESVLIPNPNFFLLNGPDIDCVLVSIDVYASAVAAYLTGKIPIPSQEDMISSNQETLFDFLNEPFVRYCFDENYYDAVNEIEGWETDSLSEEDEKTFDTMYWTYDELNLRILARIMRRIDYPDDVGDYEALNERGQRRIEFNWESGRARTDLECHNEDEKQWKTFRDCDTPEKFYSFFTGTPAVKLERPWMEM